MDELLPEWESEVRTHRRLIYCRAIRPEAFHFPKGAHGARNPEFELGRVKQLFRHFELEEEACARIPQLRSQNTE